LFSLHEIRGPSVDEDEMMMGQTPADQWLDETRTSQARLQEAYQSEKPRFLARLRAAGRGLEEAEDLVHDVYLETLERLPLVAGIRNLPAWIASLLTRRLIDLWRHERTRRACTEGDVGEELLEEILVEAGFNPLDQFVRDSLAEALGDAVRALPKDQRAIIEAQVFKGRTFREIAEATGIGMDTLTARKRYAVQNLSKALRHWIEE